MSGTLDEELAREQEHLDVAVARLEELRERILAEFERTLSDVELLVPFSQGALLNELHELAGEMEREDTPEGVRVNARIPTVVAERYDRYAVNGRPAS